MKWKRGFTLVEMIVVVAIVALMLTFGIPAFSKWKAKHDVEAQTAKLFGDLEFVRMKAYSEKIDCQISWGNTNDPFTNYSIQSDLNEDGDYSDQGETTQKTSDFSVDPSSLVTGRLRCNGRGFCETGNLRIASTTGAATDCVVVARTRIKIGRWNADDASCIPR